jgi:hypothetical protein
MLSGFDGGCVEAILPESSLPLFPIIEFLTCSSRNKLNGLPDYVPLLPTASPYFRYFRSKKAIIDMF